MLSNFRLLLLQRSDIDTTSKDLEGYTAIDLYNSTVNGTKPDPDGASAELYTWGTNKYVAFFRRSNCRYVYKRL